MKRFIALLLAVVIAATALNLVAIAGSDYEEDFFQGYLWIAQLNVTSQRSYAHFSWQGTTQISCKLETDFVDASGYWVSSIGNTDFDTGSASVTHTPDIGYYIDQSWGTYKIGSNTVYYTSATP